MVNTKGRSTKERLRRIKAEENPRRNEEPEQPANPAGKEAGAK